MKIEIQGIEKSKHWIFCATMQFRTPLRVLEMHGKLFHGGSPPEIIEEPWQGIWTPALPGQDRLFGTMASSFGQIPADGGDLLVLMLAVKRAASGDGTADEMRSAVIKTASMMEWNQFLWELGGPNHIADTLFSSFLETIPLLSSASRDCLYENELETPQSILDAEDDFLLSMPGIGKKKLSIIREACAAAKHKDCVFVMERI